MADSTRGSGDRRSALWGQLEIHHTPAVNKSSAGCWPCKRGNLSGRTRSPAGSPLAGRYGPTRNQSVYSRPVMNGNDYQQNAPPGPSSGCYPCKRANQSGRPSSPAGSPSIDSYGPIMNQSVFSWPSHRSMYDSNDYRQIGKPYGQSTPIESFDRKCQELQAAMKDCEAIYEIDPEILEAQKKGEKGFIIPVKSRMDTEENAVAKSTVMEHFHKLMKETLGERVFNSLLKQGVINKTLPDEIITRRILDALELKNKLLFTTDVNTTLDKMNFIQAAGNFRGAMKAAINATTNLDDQYVEGMAEHETTEYNGFFLKRSKPVPEIKILGYIGLTNND